jgi:hypothetical protein
MNTSGIPRGSAWAASEPRCGCDWDAIDASVEFGKDYPRTIPAIKMSRLDNLTMI